MALYPLFLRLPTRVVLPEAQLPTTAISRSWALISLTYRVFYLQAADSVGLGVKNTHNQYRHIIISPTFIQSQGSLKNIFCHGRRVIPLLAKLGNLCLPGS